MTLTVKLISRRVKFWKYGGESRAEMQLLYIGFVGSKVNNGVHHLVNEACSQYTVAPKQSSLS